MPSEAPQWPEEHRPLIDPDDPGLTALIEAYNAGWHAAQERNSARAKWYFDQDRSDIDPGTIPNLVYEDTGLAGIAAVRDAVLAAITQGTGDASIDALRAIRDAEYALVDASFGPVITPEDAARNERTRDVMGIYVIREAVRLADAARPDLDGLRWPERAGVIVINLPGKDGQWCASLETLGGDRIGEVIGTKTVSAEGLASVIEALNETHEPCSHGVAFSEMCSDCRAEASYAEAYP